MKCIYVPINKEAQKRLIVNENIEGDVIRVFLSDKSYEDMWNFDLYSIINTELNTLIDYCEYEKIKGLKKLYHLIYLIEKYGRNINNPIVPTLYSLAQAAISFKTGVYFYY